MRPHEEEWALAGTEVIPDGNRDRSAKFYGPCEPAAARAKLAHAAPDMARALLLNGCVSPTEPDSAWHTHDCWENGRASCSEACKATRAALIKAGVPLP